MALTIRAVLYFRVSFALALLGIHIFSLIFPSCLVSLTICPFCSNKVFEKKEKEKRRRKRELNEM